MPSQQQTKECPNCGKTFVCTMDAHCWCFELDIPDKAQDYIAARFDGCLCRECIEMFIDKINA